MSQTQTFKLTISWMIFKLTFKLGVTVDLWMPYMLMLVSVTLTQGHSRSAKVKKQKQTWMLSATKEAISIKLATKVGLLKKT